MWNKLSMRDKANYIRLAVKNNITSLKDIQNIYNKYAEGGNTKEPHILLPEVEITPRTTALGNARRATMPNSNFMNAQDMNSISKLAATLLNNKIGRRIFGINPQTCINTVSGFCDSEATVAANSNLVYDPERYGYIEKTPEEALPGDIIVLSNKDNHPIHAVMFDSIAEDNYTKDGYTIVKGDTLVNSSNGGTKKEDYTKQLPLSRFDDPKYKDNFSGKKRYYRFVGTGVTKNIKK